MRLIDSTTGRPLSTGAVLRSTDRQAWRYESLITTSQGCRVHVSRPSRTGRVHRHFSADVFGCHVELDITRRQHVKHAVSTARRRLDDWFMAGVVALLPLAAFEHWHIAERIFEFFGSTH